MLKRSLLVLALASLAACGQNGDPDTIQLDWDAGQTWNVAASYRVAEVHTEEIPTHLDGEADPVFGDNWTEEVAWTYQVVESGFVPEESDELYPYAKTRDEVASLAVVRAFIDPSLNDDPELIEADPVVYLVFREDRDRLAAVIAFTNVDGERLEQAWSSKELGRSWSALSQSMLTAAPTYLAPFSAKFRDEETVLEDGSLLTTESVDDGVVDAFYDDELGGDLVASRYEDGQPWPTWTVTDNVDARLMSDDEVSARRSAMPWFAPEFPENYDYRRALSASVDIEASLILDADTIDGGFEASSPVGYQPWAGSWWKQAEAALVFGYDGRDTYSDLIKADIDPLKLELDALSKEIRDMDSGAEKDAKVDEYRTTQGEFIDALVDFYGGILSDLDGGKITVADGQVEHSEDGWSYDLDELSPMDKMALDMYFDGETYPNPFYMPAWELLNHYSPGGGSWWGHCNGWAAAAILTNEPREPVDADINGQAVSYTTADMKGLLSEAHYSTYSRFYGQRYNGEEQDISDLSPAAVHRLLTFYIRDQQVPLVFDTSADEEVWNFPAYAVEMTVRETSEGGGSKVNINTADADTLDTLPGVGPVTADRIIDHRETWGPFQEIEDIKDVYGIGNRRFNKMSDQITVRPVERTFDVMAEVRFATDGVGETWVDSGAPKGFTELWGYTLTTDGNGMVLSGQWDDDEDHPDFAWIPYSNPTTRSSGGSENPYLPYGTLLDIIGEDFQRE